MIFTRFAAAVAVFAAVTTAAAQSGVGDLVNHLPDDTNSMVIIDVEKLMNNPLATKEGWADRRASTYASKPVVIPPGTDRLVMGALLNPEGNPIWQATVMEFKDAVPLEMIARSEKGALETLAEKRAVLSPIDVYFIELESSILGAMSPANRQQAAKWVRDGAGTRRPSSAYLRQAATMLGDNNCIVMAIDLQDLLNESKIRWRLDNNRVAAVAGKKYDAASLAELVAGIKGLILTVAVTDSIQGNLELSFDGDTAMLAEFIKPLLMEVLAEQGMAIPDLANWTFTTSGSKVTASGALTPWSLTNLASVVDSPVPAAVPEAEGAQGNAALTPAEASQQYYRAISAILENFQQGSSLGDSAGWMRRQSQRINRMPLLNVDPELVAWGNDVSAKLMETAAILNVGQAQVRSRAASARDDDSGYYDDGYYNGNNNNVDRGATQAQKAQAVAQATGSLEELLGARAAIRATMTERYKVEF